MKSFAEMQEEQRVWSLENFGEQPAHRGLLGMIEEFGELTEECTEFAEVMEAVAMGKTGKSTFDMTAFTDAMGDIMVFVMQYCTSQGWDLGQLWEIRSPPRRDFALLTGSLGRLAHYQLKAEQGIRGAVDDPAAFETRAQEALCRLLAELQGMCEVIKQDLLEITNRVWDEVKKRRWRDDAVEGSAR